MRKDIAWAAGLFEGEGCFRLSRQIGMEYDNTDRDVVEHFQIVMGFGGVYLRPSRSPKHKPLYIWHIGSFQHVQAAIAMFWPYMGERRKQRARETLAKFQKPVGFGCPINHRG